MTGRTTIIHPAIDPLSHKNRDLSIHELVGILANGALIRTPGPMQSPAFRQPAKRLQADESWMPATEPEDIGLLHRPIVTQVSRWDQLKGFRQLLDGFVALKRDFAGMAGRDEQHPRTVQLARLVLAGPAPGAIEDDPDGQEVLAELVEVYASLTPELQSDVAIILLPMFA